MSIKIKEKGLAKSFHDVAYKLGATMLGKLSKQLGRMSEPSKLDNFHQWLGDMIAGKQGATADRSTSKQKMQDWSKYLAVKAERLRGK